jgi:hypothetical protein
MKLQQKYLDFFFEENCERFCFERVFQLFFSIFNFNLSKSNRDNIFSRFGTTPTNGFSSLAKPEGSRLTLTY